MKAFFRSCYGLAVVVLVTLIAIAWISAYGSLNSGNQAVKADLERRAIHSATPRRSDSQPRATP